MPTPQRWLALGLLFVCVAGGAIAFAVDASGGSPARGARRRSWGARAMATRAGCVPPAAGTHRIAVMAGRIPVVLHVPPGVSQGRRPLVLVLPGAGETAQAIASYTGYSRLADERGFLVAYPTATGAVPSWNVSGHVAGKPDDVAYLRRVITTLTGPAACADPARVGVTGVSNGGGMSARLACDASDLLSAAAPVAGGYSSLPDCRPRRPIPLLEIHGRRDVVAPYHGRGAAHLGDVPTFVVGWRRRDRCNSHAARSAPAADVEELRWTCPGGVQVVSDRVSDAEHGWPGESSLRPFSSTMRTWSFLSRFVNLSRRG